MGILPGDPDRPSSPPDRVLGRNGEETAKTRTQRAQTALEIPIPKQVALLERCGYSEEAREGVWVRSVYHRADWRRDRRFVDV